MFFRDELKETMVALKLTQELEIALKQEGARGNSLSDMIKSYEHYNQGDFNEPHEYRAYKRSLLHGRYNPLRWIAHERNQVMHQSRYLISNYTKFKYTIKDAIKYIKNGRTAKMTYESTVLRIFKVLPYIVPVLFLLYAFRDKFFATDANPLLILVGSVIALGVAIRFGELLASILELLYDTYDFLQNIATNHKILFFGLVLSYLLWGKEISSFAPLLQHIKELF